MSTRVASIAILSALLTIASSVVANTWNVPGDASTIQQALNNIQPGNSILVAPGTYEENLTIFRDVTLIGEQGFFLTKIDGGFGGSTITAQFVSIRIEGFTIRNGSGSQDEGGGLTALWASGSIEGCRFLDNATGGDGGGAALLNSNVDFVECVFEGNASGSATERDGGGVWAFNSSLGIDRCYFEENVAHEGGAVAVVGGSSGLTTTSTFVRNHATSPGVAGGAVVATASSHHFRENTFFENSTANANGAAVALFTGTYIVRENIIASSSHIGLLCATNVVLECNDVWNSGGANFDGCGEGSNNFSADPLFCDPTLLDLTLDASSPCAEANSPGTCGLIGAHQVGCGSTPTRSATWGQIKSRYNSRGDHR